MFKVLNIAFFTLCFGTLKSQTHYQLIVTNLSKKNFEIDLNHLGFKNVPPSQTLVIVDSTYIDQFVLIKVNIIEHHDSRKEREIQLVTENKSKILLEIFNVDSINYGKGFRLSNLPMAASQEFLLKDFFPRKTEFTAWLKKEYVKTHQRSLSSTKRDSILHNITLGRKQYLSSIEKMISEHKNFYVTNHIFKSEFLLPKNILAIGKEKVISIFDLLNSSDNKTDIGKYVACYVDHLKSNAVGAEIKNFRFRTLDATEYDFHHYVAGSKALLIFTARGCKGCIEQIPIIKKLKKEFPDLKIVYVSLDRSVDEWKEDLNSSGYPGIITLNLPPFNFSTDLQEEFMVEFIPQLFLIDENRKILYDNLSRYEDEKLTRLRDILNEYEG